MDLEHSGFGAWAPAACEWSSRLPKSTLPSSCRCLFVHDETSSHYDDIIVTLNMNAWNACCCSGCMDILRHVFRDGTQCSGFGRRTQAPWPWSWWVPKAVVPGGYSSLTAPHPGLVPQAAARMSAFPDKIKLDNSYFHIFHILARGRGLMDTNEDRLRIWTRSARATQRSFRSFRHSCLNQLRLLGLSRYRHVPTNWSHACQIQSLFLRFGHVRPERRCVALLYWKIAGWFKHFKQHSKSSPLAPLAACQTPEKSAAVWPQIFHTFSRFSLPICSQIFHAGFMDLSWTFTLWHLKSHDGFRTVRTLEVFPKEISNLINSNHI